MKRRQLDPIRGNSNFVFEHLSESQSDVNGYAYSARKVARSASIHSKRVHVSCVHVDQSLSSWTGVAILLQWSMLFN